MRRTIFLLVIFSIIHPAKALEEEFLGPFPSWSNLKTDFGAKGDGLADDSPALQRALNCLTYHTNFCVLYLSAGVYRLTETVKTARKAHTDGMGITVVGEHPDRTILRWDGKSGGTLFQWDAWYSKISRLTLDGAGKAKTALFVGPAFSTYNETSDMVFRDAETGILFGDDKTNGQAENAVFRCRFLRCSEAGVNTRNWNSMDIWIWNSWFEDCGFGVLNAMGNYHAWENIFIRSRKADVAIKNLMAFSVVNNVSMGSRRFLDFETGHAWGSPASITGNRITRPTGDIPLLLGNAGPYLVMDNEFAMPPGSTNRAARMTWGDQTFVGNRYSTRNAVIHAGRNRSIAESYELKSISTHGLPPTPPPAPSVKERKIFEVLPGSDAEAIQKIIDAAAQLAGQRPVIHFPMGAFKIAQTLAVPPHCDAQFVGDGAAETATRLQWAGPAGGVLMRIMGPSQIVLRDLAIQAGNAQAMVLRNVESASSRVLASQLNVNLRGSSQKNLAAALRIAGVHRAAVQLRYLQGNGNEGCWVEVEGNSRDKMRQPVCVFNGATGSAAGQYRVRQQGRLLVRGVYHEKSSDALRGIHLMDSGELVVDATRFSYKTSAQAPLVLAENFKGMFTLATGMLLPVDSTQTCRIEMRGNGEATRLLLLNNQFWVYEPGPEAKKVWWNLAIPPASGGLVGCNINSGAKGVTDNGFASLENAGQVSDEMLLEHLKPIREAKVWHPGNSVSGETDVFIQRVIAEGGPSAAVLIQGN